MVRTSSNRPCRKNVSAGVSGYHETGYFSLLRSNYRNPGKRCHIHPSTPPQSYQPVERQLGAYHNGPSRLSIDVAPTAFCDKTRYRDKGWQYETWQLLYIFTAQSAVRLKTSESSLSKPKTKLPLIMIPSSCNRLITRS